MAAMRLRGSTLTSWVFKKSLKKEGERLRECVYLVHVYVHVHVHVHKKVREREREERERVDHTLY